MDKDLVVHTGVYIEGTSYYSTVDQKITFNPFEYPHFQNN